MPGRREIMRLAERFTSAPTVSYREEEVLARVRSELDQVGIPYGLDRWGNLLARYHGSRARGRPVAFSAHADHPGLIITSCRGRRAEARWLGGVIRSYFRGSRVRIETPTGPVLGSVRSTVLGTNRRVVGVRLSVEHEVPVGAIGGFDLVPFLHRPPWVRTKSADDLLGCAAVVSLMRALARTRPQIEVWGIFTRAEEDGLLGATALAQDRVLPEETAVVVLETSKELPCGRLGKGPVVRVGDRRSVYDPGVSQGLHEAAEELAGRYRSFSYQRGLMDGGVCEATSYQCFGYAAGGLALPLGNYHNMGKKKIGEEFVHEDDLWNLSRLLPVASRRIATAKDGLATLRKSLLARLKTARRDLASTSMRGFVGLLALSALAAGTITHSGPIQDDFDATTKPHPSSRIPSGTEMRAADPREDYDARHYDLFLRFDPTAEQISGELAMLLTAIEPLATVRLDLERTLVVDSAACGSVPCSFSRPSEDQVDLALPDLLESGDSIEVYLRYAGTPGPAFFQGFEFFSNHGTRTDTFPMVSTLSQPDRAHGWWPCKDRMDDKATVSMTIEAPDGFVVAGNGNRMREETDGTSVRTTWETSYPIATYLVSFVATNYVVWSETFHAADGDSVPLLFYAYPEDEEAARVDFTAMAEALAVFEDRFGAYPFRDRTRGWEKLGVAEFAWDSGAMEHQTMISYGEDFITGTHSKDWVLAHEIAHQWWGDALTPTSMDDIWLNEGFATYCEALLAEARGGPTAYRTWMRRLWRSSYSGTIIRPVDTFGGKTVYDKGGWVLHMLRGTVGEESFFELLNEYYARYRYANASTADFIRAAEETILDDLSWFFVPWLYGTGRPELAWDWWSEETEQGDEIRLYVSQTQDDPVYPEGAPTSNPPDHFSFPIEVRIFGEGDSLSQTVYVGQRTVTLSLDPIAFSPDSIALDPDQWLLRTLSPRGAVIPSAAIQVHPNPSAGRTEFWIRNPSSGKAFVSIHDIAGRRVRLLPEVQGEGIHEIVWDGADGRGRRVASGIYFVHLDGPSGAAGATRVVIAR